MENLTKKIVVLLIVTSKIVVFPHVNSCTYDKNVEKNSNVVVMHVGRGKSTTLLNKIVTFTTMNCRIYNRYKSAGRRNAIHPFKKSYFLSSFDKLVLIMNFSNNLSLTIALYAFNTKYL